MCLSRLFSAAKVALQGVTPSFLTSKRKPEPLFRVPARRIGGLIPENQYENNKIPKRLQLGYAALHYWECIPLFFCVAFDMICVLGYVGLYGGIMHRVDTQFSKHCWNNISRNMDLRNPSIHKFVVLYQRYEPWPEMQNVLDKMKQAEHRKQARLDTCGTP
ncbi:uncharacterized protein LOC125229200 [Leguminivora glycinivorella]|uniref:uncharacterized protein LOC125229200 n=1 Tax=Leguminivora glycinivorella TaxID=1035111 RepID=UPI00200F3C32|nr:uncharacterized protein LOC125229200 [Leguminivora glycinivorella]